MSLSIHIAEPEEVMDLISSLNRVSTKDFNTLNRWMSRPQTIWVATWSGHPIGAWGLVPPTLLSESAYLWMVTFPETENHEFVVVRHSQKQVQEMLRRYPKIIGHCEVGAERSIRWLRWMGADFGRAHDGLIEFAIRRHDG